MLKKQGKGEGGDAAAYRCGVRLSQKGGGVKIDLGSREAVIIMRW